MAKPTVIIAVKVPLEMAKAIKNAETRTGANKSELARDAIAFGLQQAVNSRLESAKRTKALLTIGK